MEWNDFYESLSHIKDQKMREALAMEAARSEMDQPRSDVPEYLEPLVGIVLAADQHPKEIIIL